MGTVHSRKGNGPANKPNKKLLLGANHPPQMTGYFMLSYKGDRVKVVNADSGELKLLTSIIRRHCPILKEGWDRHLTFSFRLKVGGRHCMIQLVADTLLSLYQAGWEPMTPMDMGLRTKEQQTVSGPQTTICFKRREGFSGKISSEDFGSTYSLLSKMGSSMDGENSCLCLEIFQSNYLGFHDASNTVLHELVTTIQKEWSPGIRGVSMGVASVITDYTANMPPVLTSHPQLREERYLQLEGRPWEANQDQGATENLQLAIIACLTREGYKLSMDINMEADSRVYFFIRDTEEQTGEVRIPNMTGAGLGEKDTLSVYRPMIVRSRSSFFRNCHGRTNASVRKKVRASLRRKAVNREGTVKAGGVMSYKPMTSTPAWWQQTSTDVSSDQEDEAP